MHLDSAGRISTNGRNWFEAFEAAFTFIAAYHMLRIMEVKLRLEITHYDLA